MKPGRPARQKLRIINKLPRMTRVHVYPPSTQHFKVSQPRFRRCDGLRAICSICIPYCRSCADSADTTQAAEPHGQSHLPASSPLPCAGLGWGQRAEV